MDTSEENTELFTYFSYNARPHKSMIVYFYMSFGNN